MNEIKKRIDTELRELRLPPDFAARITESQNHARPTTGSM